MRLINVHTLQLDEFFGSQIPEYQYAILSHTWEEEEVTFQEMQSLTDKPVVRNKRGFSKIELTCDQAKKDGLDWAWVDTCCIDKSSSAELSEAINSMYTWYAKSTACYAYLVDAEANHDPEVQGLNFRGSRWFTRGWTLQELIAPSTVNFFGKSWEFLGTRDTLQADIRAVTGIPWNVLRQSAARFGSGSKHASAPPVISSPLEKFSVAQKMSWASKRQTTREEDVAYCMLGLLGIHMPLLYGEGSKAFLRLQEEIIKQIDDQSLFAWAVDSKDPRAWSIGGLLANSPADFADCSTIGSLTDEVGEPSVLTKKGLYIHAPILPLAFPDTSRLHSYGTGNAYTRRGMHPQLFQLVLNCRSLDSFSSPVTIWIYRTDEWSIKDIDRRVFARVMAPGIRQYWGERNADEFTELTELTEDFKRIYLTMKTQPDQPFIGGGIHLHGIPLLFRHPLYDSYIEPLWEKGWCLINDNTRHIGSQNNHLEHSVNNQRHRRLKQHMFHYAFHSEMSKMSVATELWQTDMKSRATIETFRLIGSPMWDVDPVFVCGTVSPSPTEPSSDSGLVCWFIRPERHRAVPGNLQHEEAFISHKDRSWPPIIYPNGNQQELALVEAKCGETVIEVLIYRDPTSGNEGTGLASVSAQAAPHFQLIFSSHSVTDTKNKTSMLEDYKSLGRLSSPNRDVNINMKRFRRLKPEPGPDSLGLGRWMGDTSGNGVRFVLGQMLRERELIHRIGDARLNPRRLSNHGRLEWCRMYVFEEQMNGRKGPRMRWEQKYRWNA